MKYFSWTPSREIWIEPNPRISVVIGVFGVLVTLVGLVFAEPAPVSTVAEQRASTSGDSPIFEESRVPRKSEWLSR